MGLLKDASIARIESYTPFSTSLQLAYQRIRITWMTSGGEVVKIYKVSLSENSELRHDIEDYLGRPLKAHELREGVDLEKL